MNSLPFELEHKYYGDEWLEFHDYLNTLTDREGIFVELSFHLGLINPRELAYKTGGKDNLLNNIKCLIEINREEDTTKHEDILQKYGLTKVVEPKINKDNTGIM